MMRRQSELGHSVHMRLLAQEKEKKINGKRVRRPSTSQKCHPASLDRILEVKFMGAESARCQGRVASRRPHRQIQCSRIRRSRARCPRLRSGSVPRTLYTFAQDTGKDHGCGSEQSFRAEDTRSGTPVKAGEAVIKEMTKRQVARWLDGPRKTAAIPLGSPHCKRASAQRKWSPAALGLLKPSQSNNRVECISGAKKRPTWTGA